MIKIVGLAMILYLMAYYYQREIAGEPEPFTQFGITVPNPQMIGGSLSTSNSLQGLLNYYENPNACCCKGYYTLDNPPNFTFNLNNM